MPDNNLILDDKRKSQLDSNIKNMIEGGIEEEDVLKYAAEFKTKFGVKKKAESDSSLDISAGPYASGQKPKGFGDIVSEKISEVSPQEEKQIKAKEVVKTPQQPKQVQKTTTDSYGQQAMDAIGSGIMSTIDALALGGLHAVDIMLPTGSEIGKNETINKAISKVKEANVTATQESQDRQALLPFNGSPSDAFMAGEWGTVAKLTGLKVLNSVPTSIAMGSNPAVAASWAIGNVSNEYSKLKKEGYSDTQAAVDASINTSSEILVDRLFGGAKQVKALFAQGGKEAVKSVIKKKLALELGKTYVENIGGEELENLASNLSKKYVLGKKDQDLFEGSGDIVFTSFGTSTLYSPLTIINTAKNNLIAKEQAKEATPTTPELPPDTGGGAAPKLDLQNLDPDMRSDIENEKESLEHDLRFNERLSSVNKPKNILEKGIRGIENLLGEHDLHKEYTGKAEDTKRKLDLLENNPIAYYEEKIADFNKYLKESKDDEKTRDIESSIRYYEGVIEDLKNEEQPQEQAVPLSDDINSQFGESSDFISGLIDILTEDAESEYPSQSNADQYLALLKYNPKKYLKNRIDYYTKLDNKSGDNYWSENLIPRFQKALDDLEKNKVSFDDVMSYSKNQGDSPNADADNIDLTQLVKAKEVVQKIIDNDGVATSIDGTPVDIQELNEQGNAVLQDGSVVPMSDITVHSELGDNPLVDVVNAELDNEQQVPDSQPEQQQAPPTELPKKIFHATKASFEGLPSRQEQGKVSSFGTEPAGTFYSTNPDQAKQAIGDGGDARVIEADFNPKNPLVIENTDNEAYANIKNESQQQAVEEFFDEYAESGVDLTTLEEGEIPEKVKKRTTEIFADKLKEQGYDAVVNNDNGDIIVLDDTIVTEKKDESVASPTTETERSQQVQELKDELDALDTQDDSKLTEKERKRIKSQLRHTVTAIARGYFLDGGKILWDSLKKETGFKGGEFKDFLGIVSKTGRTVDGIAQHLWENRDNDNFDTSDYKDAIIEVLGEPRDEWYVRQKNEVDSDSNQNILEQKQRIQEQIDILEDADLSFEDIKNELEANEAMWQRKFETEGHPKQKSGTFVNDIPKALEYLAKMKELEDGTKKRNMQSKIDEITSKDPKLKKIIENFDIILKQLNYTSDC